MLAEHGIITPENAELARQIEYSVERILAAKSKSAKADTRDLEAAIDECVYTLYGLTAAEVALIAQPPT